MSFAFAIALTGSAQAADLVVQPGEDAGFRSAWPLEYARYPVRADQILIYDFEPGVVTRAYWFGALAQPPLFSDDWQAAATWPP